MNGKYLTERERYQLEILLKQKISKTEIARILGISRKTVYNEIRRGSVTQLDTLLSPKQVYCADRGQQVRLENGKNKGRPWKIESDYDFVNYVENMILQERYSPYALLQKIKNDGLIFKTEICETTLYSYIHQGVFLNVTTADLPYRKKKQSKKKVKRSVSLKQPVKPSIEDRPDHINDRLEPGHWEMDTVYSGKRKSRSCLLVLTERMTLNELVLPMKDRKAETVTRTLNRLYRSYGAQKFKETFKTITCDNGAEFSEYEKFSKNGNRFQIYFCHPYNSGERGSNENQNKLIRRWYKKGDGLDLKKCETERLQHWINDYPRKKFNGLSSNMYCELCTNL